MSRQAQSMLLFLLGAVVLKVGIGGQYLRYLRPGFRPILLSAGVALIVLAVATAWYEWQAARTRRDTTPSPAEDGHPVDADGHPGPGQDGPAEHALAGPAQAVEEGHRDEGHAPHGHGGHGHGHGHREPRISWLLVLPLVTLIAALPPALGSYAADRAGTGLQPPPGFPTLPAGDPVRTTLDDYATRAVYQHGSSLGSRKVELTGFIGFGDGGTPYLIRMIVSCCAADAMPIKIALTGNVPADLRADGWVDVVGTYSPRQTKDDVNGGPIPYLTVVRATTVPQPADPYET